MVHNQAHAYGTVAGGQTAKPAGAKRGVLALGGIGAVAAAVLGIAMTLFAEAITRSIAGEYFGDLDPELLDLAAAEASGTLAGRGMVWLIVAVPALLVLLPAARGRTWARVLFLILALAAAGWSMTGFQEGIPVWIVGLGIVAAVGCLTASVMSWLPRKNVTAGR
ncbi:hypothetical protein ACTG9Q_15705 [Actinokineospora sp. 24-640]